MRDFKGMKRQRGRNRGGGGGGGKPNAGNANRAFDSNGPDGVKIRGAAQHVFEKYQQLARDAAGGGDRVLAENYLQHAEHYFRLIRTLQPQRAPAEIMGRETFASGYDIDFEDESGAQALPPEPVEGEAAAGGADGQLEGQGDGRSEGRDQQQRGDGRRDDREFRRDREGRDGRDGREGYGQRERGEGQGRGDGPREARGDRPERGERQERGDRPERGGEPRGDQPRADRPDREPRGERGDRPRRDRDFDRDRPREGRGERRDEQPRPAFGTGGDAPASAEDDGQMLRDASGGFSPAPAFLQAAAPAVIPTADDAEDERPVRARRRRPSADEAVDEARGEGGDAPSPAEAEEV